MDKSKVEERTNLACRQTGNIVDSFTEELKSYLGGSLKSVILYGSAVAGDYSKKFSDINILVALDAVSSKNLSILSKIKHNPKFRRVSPIVFTKVQLENTTDTFPIEFLDMQESHIAVFGEDYLKDLKIDLKNLRYQCEWELKSKIIQMQRFYVNDKIKNKFLNGFLIKNLSSFIVIFKNILRLNNITETKKDKILERIASEFNLDKEIFNKLYQARIYKISDTGELFVTFLSELQQLADKIDALLV